MTRGLLSGMLSEAPVLCVDVDGTLLRTDLLYESLLYLIRHKPWMLLVLPFWLIRGRAYMKQQLARSTSLADITFPVHQKLFQFMQTESERGRRLVLCSASDKRMVDMVAAQLQIPVEVFASDGAMNLKGKKKAQLLVERFGSRGFDYAGNESADLPVWDQARHAIVVNASPRVQKAAQQQGNVSLVLPRTRNAVSSFFRSLRPHQWVKNLLVFVPLITSHNLLDLELWLSAVVAFLSMNLCASSVYIVNDLADIEADRRHPSKKNRPFASGELSILSGLLSAPLLLGIGVCISLFLPGIATVLLLLYVVLATAYTFWIKRKLLADVVTLALLYTVRIIEGGTATSILVSPWLLAFSLFFFLSLAFSKRVAEMIRISTASQNTAAGRGYFVPDVTTLSNLGSACGYISCLVLSFYINSDSVRKIYPHPGWLWLLLPLMLYWFGRIWILTMRGKMSDDPIMFMFKDLHTHVSILCGGLILLLAVNCPVGIPGVLE